ncbi:MAG: c-type cytochrome, partial [Pirellulaceae bacterium]|nr:c-type cytochrome [Pirellulaceae bacterium]
MTKPLFLIVSLVLVSALAAQEGVDDEESPFRPGLLATYRSGEQSAQRIDESLAFDWQAAAPDPRLPAGSFTATWRGRLWTQATGAYRLHAFVQGKLKIEVDGKPVLSGTPAAPGWLASEPLDWTFDYRPLVVTFEKTAADARLALFWSGPGFSLEPIPDRFLFHDREGTIPTNFARGRQLAAALRCAACHGPATSDPLPAPALDKLSGNIARDWLMQWLSVPATGGEGELVRRMPHFDLTPDEAAAVAAWLLRAPAEKLPPEKPSPKPSEKEKKSKQLAPSASQGERLFLTLGCLACHQHGELGESGLFGGGDLTHIAAKRPAEYFARWLADPASLNRDHRMPLFELSAAERTSLSLWLAEQGKVDRTDVRSAGKVDEGQKLVARFRCAACHRLEVGEPVVPEKVRPITTASDWSRSCAGSSDSTKARPGYRLSAADQRALQAYYSATLPAAKPTIQARGRDLLVKLNCLSCHLREGIDRQTASLPARLQDKLAAVVAVYDDLGKQVPAMTPPALNSVGDKLTGAALAAAIRREGPVHRSYLQVRMPKFRLTDEQLADLASYFVVTDRIPRGAGVPPAEPIAAGETPAPRLAAAGPRLVTSDGFGCTSCHQVGSVLPDKAPLNARGPSLSMLEKRIRKEWFDRWCANPARIVPRMEMPSVQVPVRGVLNEKIGDQLAAVWHTLNTPGFEPPEPNPVRVLRLSGVPERKEAPIVLHDVIKDGDKTYLFPLVIGLPNRHNILFDLETNRLAAWWLGDTARQRTKGKSWWWEQGGNSIFEPEIEGSEVSLVLDEKEYLPVKDGQFVVSIRDIDYEPFDIDYDLQFDIHSDDGQKTKRIVVRASQSWDLPKESETYSRTVVRGIYFSNLPEKSRVIFKVMGDADVAKASYAKEKDEFVLPGRSGLRIRLLPNSVPLP